MTSPRPWRVGRKVGRTIYTEGVAVSALIGVMDTREDAALVVAAVNESPLPVERRLAHLIEKLKEFRDQAEKNGNGREVAVMTALLGHALKGPE